MYTFNFNSKAQYLQQKKEWHSAFLAQLKKIRFLKNNYKQAQREGTRLWIPTKAISDAHSDLSKLLSERSRSREQAYLQMKAENPAAPSFHELTA